MKRYPARIKLVSRYGDNNYLERFFTKKENIWYKLYDDSYTSIHFDITDGSRNIIAVDPPGGPFIAIGDTTLLEGHTLFGIEDTPSGILFCFKKSDSISNQ